jgi:hypothetical protein
LRALKKVEKAATEDIIMREKINIVIRISIKETPRLPACLGSARQACFAFLFFPPEADPPPADIFLTIVFNLI